MAKAKKFSYPVTTLIGSRVSNLIAICKSHKIGKEYLGKLTLTFVVSGILEIFNGYELLLKTKQIQEVKNDTPPDIYYWFLAKWHNITSQFALPG